MQVVIIDEVGKGTEVLIHLTCDAFGPDVLLPHPRMRVTERIEGAVDEIAAGLGIPKAQTALVVCCTRFFAIL